MSEPDIRPILAVYTPDCRPSQVEFLAGAGGFSGALFWRLTTPRGLLCLRRWPPEHPSLSQLPYIHGVLRQIFEAGFRLVPRPLATIAGQTFVQHASHLWELTPWLPGEASYARGPTAARLAQAMQCLARFHRAAETFPAASAWQEVSPGIRTRRERLKFWISGSLDRLGRTVEVVSVPRSPLPVAADLRQRARRLCDLFATARPVVENSLDQALTLRVALQPCIRDIWHDHILFTGDDVTGLIDFGALAHDNVATDVARLLGSLVADDAEGWRAGLAAYESVRRLTASEALLVTAFDRANVLLSGLNWCRWHYFEDRQFADWPSVLARIDANLERLVRLAASCSDVL